MQTIGERLLDARQRRGVSIREAAESTKVRGDYLAAMEANQFDSIPLADVYRRGFLKIYARFLRLDSDRIVGDFNALLAARNPIAPRGRRGDFIEPVRSIEPREPEGMDEFSSGAIETAERPDNRRGMILIGGGLLAALLITLLVSHSCSSSDKPEGGSAAAAHADTTGEVLFSNRSNRPVTVTVTRRHTEAGGPAGSEVFRSVVPAQGSVVMRATGEYIVAAPEPVFFRINGGSDYTFDTGRTAAFLTVPAKAR